jgi:hypothetical protein
MALLRSSIAEDPDKKFDMVQMYNYTTFDVMVCPEAVPFARHQSDTLDPTGRSYFRRIVGAFGIL